MSEVQKAGNQAALTMDRQPSDHFGGAFYFRHTPTRAMVRLMFYVFTGVMLIFLVVNAMQIWPEHGSFMSALRKFFGFTHGSSPEDVAKSVCGQFYVAALILSAVIAPLLSTYSFVLERSTGTIEFLRLSPIPTVGIVLGKMFAPAYPLHVISLIFLTLGSILGILGGLPMATTATAFIFVVMGIAVLHALGMFCASQTTTFRGFGAVILFIGLGGAFSLLPFVGFEERVFSFLVSLSPWAAADQFLWHEVYRPWRYENLPPCFFGSAAGHFPFIVVMQACFFGVLTLGSIRKTNDPAQAAIPQRGWLLLWILVVITAFGIWPNTNQFPPGGYYYRPERDALKAAATVRFFGALFVILASLWDHPFRRELSLSLACEKVAGRAKKSQKDFTLKHADFLTLLTAASAVLFIIFSRQETTFSSRATPWQGLLIGGVVVTASVFFFAVIFEAAEMFFHAPLLRRFVAFGLCCLLATLLIIPTAHITSCYMRWERLGWQATLIYGALILSYLAGMVLLRKWAYRRLEREAQEAVAASMEGEADGVSYAATETVEKIPLETAAIRATTD
jgi:hypothetical protein